MRQVSQVNVLVHPDFDATSSGRVSAELHPAQLRAREAWVKKIDEISTNDGAVLIYLSILTKAEFYIATLEAPNPVLRGVRQDDFDRTQYCDRMLGIKFIPITSDTRITPGLLRDRFSASGLAIDPESTELVAFGEYFNACVGIEGKRIQKVLGIPDQNYRKDLDLSLPSGYERVAVGQRSKESV